MIGADVLEDLGLTKSEIKAYVALLKLGSSSAGPVIQESGMQTSVVHRALLTLAEKGLIHYVYDGKHKIYHASDPEYFYRFIEDKRSRFDSVLPVLKKFQAPKPDNLATIYQGTKGVTEVYNTLVNASADEYLTFGGGEQCANRMGMTWWLNMHTKRVANKLSSRQVFDETVKPMAGPIEDKSITNIKYLSKEFASFQETVICGDYVAITVFADNPYSFLIKDSQVAKGYKKHFEILWEQAK
jgi:sugar-specific transcriptional regulator TrmB